MSASALDLRLAWRRLARRPTASLVAIATLAVGIGAAVAMFSLWDALLLRPLDLRRPDRLVAMFERSGKDDADLVGWPTFEDWRTRAKSFSAMAVAAYWSPTLLGGEAESLSGLRVGPGYLAMLGVQPALGRDFLPEEDERGKHRVVLLSDALWRQRFGADPGVVGRNLSFDGFDYKVVGVLPRGFEAPTPADSVPSPPMLYAPLAYNASLAWACRTCHHLRALGRLAEGVDLAAAESELDAIGKSLAREYAHEYNGGGAFVKPLQEVLYGEHRPLLRGLLAAVGLLLLIATANLASMQLAAAVPRRQEMAVRGALGARSADMARLLLAESALVGLGGALGGAVVAQGLLRLTLAFAPASLTRLQQAAVDGRALAVAVGLGLATALAFGALPARAAGRDAARALAGARGAVSDRGRRRALATLVAVDVALGVVLLAGAALLGGSLRNLVRQDPGFRARSLLTLGLTVGGQREAPQVLALYSRIVAETRASPGVVGAGISSQMPLTGSFDGVGVHPERGGNANPELDPAGDRYVVTPSFLDALGVPIFAGRGIEESDRQGSPPVAVVSAALAHRLWPGEPALGQHLKVGGAEGPWLTVVGVVGDVRHRALDVPSPGAIYLPAAQGDGPDTDAALAVRATGDPAALARAVRELVRRIDPNTAISKVATVDELIARSTASRRFAALLVGGFALVALLLSALGVQGVVAHSVGERRRELGLRRALGASGVALLGTMYGRLLAVAAAGALAGLAGALAFGRALASQLYGVDAADPLRLAAVALVLLAVAAASAALPARRALAVAPADALREE